VSESISAERRSIIITHQICMGGRLFDILGDARYKPVAVLKVGVEVGLVDDTAWLGLDAEKLVINESEV
jgi:hypothetical protein